MNVYEIGEYIIAAKDSDSALGVYVEETNELEFFVVGDLGEGETEEITIKIRRLTQSEIDSKQVECCSAFDEDCKYCDGQNGPVYRSYQDMINDRDESTFPCVIAKEI